MNCSTPGLPVHHQLPEFTETHVHRVSDAISHLILCRPLLLLPPISPSIRVFSNESTLRMRWPKYWSFSFSIFPSKEIPGLIFRMEWLDLLTVQGTLKSLLQHHSSKALILWPSAFFTVPTLTSIYDHWKNHIFNIFSYLLSKSWVAFLGAWCPLPAFRSCFVEFTWRLNGLLMNLWGRKCSPRPTPPPSWLLLRMQHFSSIIF